MWLLMLKLLKKDNQIIRILKTRDNKVLVIDCLKKTMPAWITSAEIESYVDCTKEELYEVTNVDIHRELSGDEKKIAHERFTSHSLSSQNTLLINEIKCSTDRQDWYFKHVTLECRLIIY